MNFQLRCLPQGKSHYFTVSTDKRDYCREAPFHLREHERLSWLCMRSLSTLGGSS
ncbi:hypothetical protein HMPREF0970_01565 [Schaalia odontolytica F0309]|uniref:Uncharacterized protein n=1 Tax=Schaalia odontolytica F0309 TaxID=649742 RepID=D4U029_9ACTO|nr:hypothetical protein HMPREF0970_01565 [Schaalia odontolytica F0309]